MAKKCQAYTITFCFCNGCSSGEKRRAELLFVDVTLLLSGRCQRLASLRVKEHIKEFDILRSSSHAEETGGSDGKSICIGIDEDRGEMEAILNDSIFQVISKRKEKWPRQTRSREEKRLY